MTVQVDQGVYGLVGRSDASGDMKATSYCTLADVTGK